MCSVTPRWDRRKMSLIVGSEDEEVKEDTVTGLSPTNDEVFYDRKYNPSDDEAGESAGEEDDEKNEEVDCREAIEKKNDSINRIDSLRETRIKVVKKKKPGVRHTPQHSLQPTPHFTLKFTESGIEEIVFVRRGMTLKQVALPFFETNVLDFLAYDFFLDGSNSALPIHAQSDLLAGCVIHAVKRDINLIREAKEKKKRSSTGALSTSTTNLATQQRDKNALRQRRASFGFIFPTSFSKSNDIDSKESSFSAVKRPAVRIHHAGSLQKLDYDYIEMPSGSLPRIKSQPNPMQRLSRILSPSKERLDRLNDTLQAFETTGIPIRFSKVNPETKFQVKPKWLYLERSWEDIVHEPEKLSLQDKIQQSVLWELLCTEANYIRNLKYVVDVHLATLVHLQNSDEKILCDIDTKKMFSNFEEIYTANGLFWKKYFYKLLKNARKSRTAFDLRYLHEGFMNISQLFAPYISFCIDTNECRKYVQLKKDGDPLFAKLLRWADSKISSDSNKEGLKDQLSKPFQRLMRYKLLLDRIKDETSDIEQYRMLSVMVNRVANFVQDVDDRVDASQKFEALTELAKRMEYAIPPESAGEEFSRFSEKYPTFNLLLPMPYNNNYRELVFEGPLRYRDNFTSKWADVHGFLFTDMFLVGKPSKRGLVDRIKVFRPPVKLEKIFIEKYSDSPLQYVLYILDDFGYLRMINAITGHQKKLNEWVKRIQTAKKKLTEGATGIDRQKLPENAVSEEPQVSLVVTPASPAGNRLVSPITQTLAITDMRRRFRASNSSENSLRPSPANSHSSIDLALAEEDEDEDEEDGDDDVMEATPVRAKTHFLRTASPLQPNETMSASPPEASSAMSDGAFRNRRGSRGDRRYRTADSVIPGSTLRSASIHKRLSLNYGGNGHETPTSPTVPGLPATSVESFQSSSGFSSSGSAQHLHSGSEYSEPGGAETEGQGNRILVMVGPLRDRGIQSAKRMSAARHCMSLNDLTRLHLDTISDANDNDEDSPEGNSSSTSVRSVLKQYVVVHSSDGEATDV